MAEPEAAPRRRRRPRRATADSLPRRRRPRRLQRPRRRPTSPRRRAAEPPPASGPVFTLVRAEPDGTLVAAGIGAPPDAEVAVYSNGELLGTTKAEATGDWVFVPDAPLPAGGVELTVGVDGEPVQSAQSFVVVIDEDKTSRAAGRRVDRRARRARFCRA